MPKDTRTKIEADAKKLGARLVALYAREHPDEAAIMIPCDCAVYKARYGDLAWLAWYLSGCSLTGECS